MNRLDLRETQSWMMALLTAPGGLAEGLQYTRRAFAVGAEDALAANVGADRITRLSVYTNSYRLRLEQCLEADFPALLHLMGADLFRFFAASYIRAHPSGSTTLYDLGQGFADFLQATQAAYGDAQDADLILPLELARLERKRTEVTRAKGLEDQERHNAPLDPMAHLFTSGLIVRQPPCLRLLEQGYPLIEFLQAIDLGETSPPIPEPGPHYVAITRMRYRVSTRYLEPWQYYFLQAAQRPASVNACAQQAAARAQTDKQGVLEELIFWLPIAVESGLIQFRAERQRG